MDEALRRFFEARPDVRLAYVFGSQARGDADGLSDLDVAVLFDPRPEDPMAIPALAIALGRAIALDPDRVDLCELNGASLLFLHQVLKDGRCAFARTEAERVTFEAGSLSMYYDFLPVIEEYNRHQRDWLRRASA